MMNVTKFGIYLLLTGYFLITCKKKEDNVAGRSYVMGFQNSAPRQELDLFIQSLNIWTIRADAAMITTEVPWDSLLSGKTAQSYINNNYKGLVNYYRSKNMKLWVYIDPANGLDRTSDALALRARKKSIAQPDIQKVYRQFALAMDSILKPEHLGLALETNFIRDAAPDSIYKGVKKAANDAYAEIHSFDNHVKISISVQVDWAWGKLGGGDYRDINQDFVDFPFMEELGLSSYPYFGFDDPKDIPLNYYSRLIEGKAIPVFVSEGGWSSATVTSFTGNEQKQNDYLIRQSQLLDRVHAIALFQLVFTDIDLSALQPGVPSNINLFAYLGLVDTNLKSKPALEAWDSIFKRPLIGN